MCVIVYTITNKSIPGQCVMCLDGTAKNKFLKCIIVATLPLYCGRFLGNQGFTPFLKGDPVDCDQWGSICGRITDACYLSAISLDLHFTFRFSANSAKKNKHKFYAEYFSRKGGKFAAVLLPSSGVSY